MTAPWRARKNKLPEEMRSSVMLVPPLLARFGSARIENDVQGCALGVRAEGQVMFWNKVYDGALGWTSELSKFGAHAFQSDPHRVITFGGKPLVPAEVDSPYIIRVAIALLMLASSIQGRSTIYNATPIRRAHPRFVENLVSLGAKIEWVGTDA